MDQRIVKVPLPVEQIRRMDALISSRIGGFESRAEFVHEAVEGLIMELTFEEATPQSGSRASDDLLAGVQASRMVSSGSISRASLDMTLLRVPPRGPVQDDGFPTSDSGIMFGLHNRDYPSLWSLFQLAHMTQAGPVQFGTFVDEVIRRAWDYGEVLERLEQELGTKLSALFPTNRDKPTAAGERFRVFGIGGFQERDGTITSSGPLFRWGVAGLSELGGGLFVAPTSTGYDLMEKLDGITASSPHDQRFASAFLNHLLVVTPEDAAGFLLVLTTLESGATRDVLLEAFAARFPEHGQSEVSVNAQAYVARCREWGLVEGRQVRRRYALTDFGTQYLNQVEGTIE